MNAIRLAWEQENNWAKMLWNNWIQDKVAFVHDVRKISVYLTFHKILNIQV